MVFLKSLNLQNLPDDVSVFPFCLHLFQNLNVVKFETSVSFIVGENGSGKSTLLEALALAVGSITIGSEGSAPDASLDAVRPLSDCFRLGWQPRTHRGFFLRAEDFFGYTKQLRQLTASLQDEADKYLGDDYGSKLARGSLLGQKNALVSKYGENLDANSHGESFLKLFQQRFVPGGLYILDEPEVPLSPLRQLSLLSLLKDMVENHNAQFIIATHSPILMAFPNADIFYIADGKLAKANYDDIEHVKLSRDFINNPQQFLKHL